MYPEDSLQTIIHPSPWWVKAEDKELKSGRLVYAFIPHVDQVPHTIKAIGRKNAEEHTSAQVEIAPLRMQDRLRRTDLPVAGMTLHDGEIWTAYKAKKRPCLVLGNDTQVNVDDRLRRGMPKRSTAPTVLVAPFYGADKDGSRAGYNAALVERIRHAEYPQFFWDMLPIGGPKESILRLDHLQPVGTHYNSYALSEYSLSVEALELMTEWVQWVMFGGVPEDSLILDFCQQIQQTFLNTP